MAKYKKNIMISILALILAVIGFSILTNRIYARLDPIFISICLSSIVVWFIAHRTCKNLTNFLFFGLISPFIGCMVMTLIIPIVLIVLNNLGGSDIIYAIKIGFGTPFMGIAIFIKKFYIFIPFGLVAGFLNYLLKEYFDQKAKTAQI